MKKRITSTLLLFCAVLFLFSLLPVTAQAETEGDWEYTVSSGLATVTKYNGTDAEVTIPNAFGLYQVTAIGNSAFAGNVTMTEIHFPKSLTTIGEKAFDGCLGLKEITLPAKLTKLGAYAFQNCTWLTKITFTCANLSDSTFYTKYGDTYVDQPFHNVGTAGDGIEVIFADGCTRVPANLFLAYSGAATAPNVVSVTLADSITEIGANAFRGCVYLQTVDFGSIASIGSDAFRDCAALTDFVWSEKLTTINSGAFANCTKLTAVTLPKSVATIGDTAFSGCSALAAVEFSKSLTTIGSKAFDSCVSLTEITLPEKLVSLGAYAFQNCTQLTKITINSTKLNDSTYYTKYGDTYVDEPFHNTGTAGDGIEVIFAEGCTRVPGNIFLAYSGVETAPKVVSVTIADTVTEIGKNAFWGCPELKSVDFGSVVTIGDNTFQNCIALTDIVWSEKLTTIGTSAFQGCIKLAAVTLPKNLTTIGGYAFSGCTVLKDVAFPDGLTTIEERAFKDCASITEITFPEKLVTLGAYSFQGCTQLTKITFNCTKLSDNDYYTKYGDTYVDEPFYNAGTVGDGIEVVFAEGCTRIPANLFLVYSGVETAPKVVSVTIADTVTEIGKNAFRGCPELESVDFGSVVTIDTSAFQDCIKLAAVTLPKSLTTIGGYAFSGCIALKDIVFAEGLMTIGERAFKDCTSVTEIVFPEKLVTLGAYSFQNCTQLTKITFNCTKLNDTTYYTKYGDTYVDEPFCNAGTAGDGIEVIFAEGCTRVPGNIFLAYSGVETAPKVVSVTIADTVTEIGKNAFWGCPELGSVDFGSVVTIGNNAFQNCISLTDFVWSEKVTTIGTSAFQGCIKLNAVSLPDSLNTIGGSAFAECTALKSISLNDSLTTLGEKAFMDCVALNEVTLPEKLVSLGANTFQNCTQLEKIVFNCVKLNDSAYYTKYGDTYVDQPFYNTGTAGSGIEVVFAKGCTRIPANVFLAYSGAATAPKITSILVADTVTQVGANAFTNCGDLKTLRFMGSNPAIADNAFTGVVANGYHPGWPEEALLDYGGDITWERWDAVCDHAHTELRDSKAAACTEEGYTGDIVCLVCGEVLETGEPIPELGHSWNDGEVTREPTATEPGEMTYTCQVCGEINTEEIGATACDHSVTELQNEKDATCSEEGYTGDMVCVACGGIIEPGEAIPVIDHTWNDGEITREPTVTEPGEMTYTCEVCGETKTEEISPSACDHTDTELQNAADATCTEEGYTGDTVCTVCGEILEPGETIPVIDHTWNDGEITREPTVTEPGEMTYTCDVCGETRTEEIDPSACAHANTELQNASDATCTEEGYTGDTVCLDCGETVTTGEATDPLGHTEVIDKAVEPTCTETGLTEGKHCDVCGEVLVKQEIVDKLPHEFEDGSCTDCGEKDPDWEEDTTEPSDPTDPTDPDDDIVPPVNPNVIRIAGTNRFETAFKVADQMKENLGVEKFDAIIVASGTNFPDALSGSYLAAVKSAPILLSFNEAYNDQAKNYIRENLSADGIVYLLGSEDVVHFSFEDDLEGFNVKRLAGANRFDTNLAILEEVGVEGKEILVCSGLGFADSLSASATELPILLVWNNLFENQKAFLEEYAAGGKFCIIGGETAVSKQMENQIAKYGETRRVGGSNRFMTSVMIAETFFDGPESAVLAYAWNYPDGLCGGALASTMDAPLILTMTKYENAAAGYIQSEGIDKGAVLGGTGLISEESVKMIFGEPKADPGYTVTFNSMGGSAVASQSVEKGKSAKAPEEPTREGYAFLGWYPEKEPENIQDTFLFEGTEITGDITLYALWLDTGDTDGDQLVNGLEAHYGTDINNPDTDGDTVSDYIEVVLLGTDPLKDDADLDTDGDTLSNAREIELGTDPSSADSDMDGLADNGELELGTDPMNEDTDGDGVSDGKEVELGTDPLTKESSFAVAVTADAEDTVTASVQMTLSGEQVESLSVEPILDTHLFPQEMPGYMGQAYDFRVEGEFETATIQFEFDPDTLGEGEEPAIFYFNEQEQELEELETTVEGNIASAVVNHFSTYVLINSTVYYDAFAWEDVWESDSVYDAVELVFAIDDSGSMGPVGANNDPYNMRLTVARDLVDKLPGDSKIGVVWFAEEGTMLTSELITDRDAAKDLLTTKYFKSAACSHTSMYDGINVSFGLFQSTDDSVLKMLVVLSDGIADDTHLHSSVVDTALANNVKIYSVGLGSSTEYFTSYMKPLAEQTGGSFYLASQADELAEIYADINKEIDLQTNSDKDSIPDYYEDNMYSFNGMKIEMDKYKEDTDGDGLKDDEEIEFSLKYNEDKTRVYVKGKLKSYPHLEDSDNDAILDPDDPKPMEYTITDRTLAFVEGLSYTDLKAHVGKTVGQAIEAGAKVDNLSAKNAGYLKDAVIIHANNSGYYDWLDILKTDKGLGSVALKFVRKTEPTAVIFAIRGTEPTKDLANDAVTDVDLGFSWSSKQSEIAFKEYKSIATNKNYDYYVTGHSLGGRLAQDVLYKVYNANEGGFLKKKANIPTPVHSATFNGLGYNRVVYITLENDVLAEYKNKLTNYYYWQDIVGETLGTTALFDRAGTDVLLEGRNADGSYFRGEDRSYNTWLYVPDATYHGILNFHEDYDLFYTSPHSFSYWAD